MELLKGLIPILVLTYIVYAYHKGWLRFPSK